MSGDPSDDPKNYKVGDKKPPKHAQFKPGESGNPNGRPKGKRNLKTDLLAELEKTTTVRENGRDITISRQQAVFKSLIDIAIGGNVPAAIGVSKVVGSILGKDENSGHDDATDEDQKLLEDHIEREVSRRMALYTASKDQT